MTLSTVRRNRRLRDLCGFGDGVTFLTEPLAAEVEITGPIAARYGCRRHPRSCRLFVVVRAFTRT